MIRVACADARLRVSSQPRLGPRRRHLGLLVGGLCARRNRGPKLLRSECREPRPRYDPRAGQVGRCPRPAWLYGTSRRNFGCSGPAPAREALRTEVRGGAAPVSAWLCEAPATRSAVAWRRNLEGPASPARFAGALLRPAHGVDTRLHLPWPRRAEELRGNRAELPGAKARGGPGRRPGKNAALELHA